jgi:signal transduction histidine kinase
MTLSHGAGLRLLIVALALLIGMQIMIVGAGYYHRVSTLGHPAGPAAVEQIAAAAGLLDQLTDDQRTEALRAVSSPFIQFSIIGAFPEAQEERPPLRAYRPMISAYKVALGERPFRTYMRFRGRGGDHTGGSRGPRLRAPEFFIVMKLADGKGLVAEPFPAYRRQMATSLFAFLSSIVGVILLGALVWASFATSRPLARMAAAAEKIASDLNAPPMAEEGPKPVRNLSRALNRMHGDIRKLVSERTVTLAAVAHDFRTYLTRLRLRAEFISDGDQRDKAVRDLDEMTALIEDTLLFARYDERAADLTETDVAAVVRSVSDAMCETGAKSTFASEDIPLIARAHEASLRRAVANLMDNAVKYGAVAHADVRKSGADIVITIRDEGPGVTAEDLARLTEPFYRAENSRSRKTGGAGLGLTIAKKMVEASGGTLTILNGVDGGLVAVIRFRDAQPAP